MFLTFFSKNAVQLPLIKPLNNVTNKCNLTSQKYVYFIRSSNAPKTKTEELKKTFQAHKTKYLNIMSKKE